MEPKKYAQIVASLIDQEFGYDTCTGLLTRFMGDLPDVLNTSQFRQVNYQLIFANKLPPLIERLLLSQTLDENISAQDLVQVMVSCAVASTTVVRPVAEERNDGVNIMMISENSSVAMTQVFLLWLLAIGHIGGTMQWSEDESEDESSDHGKCEEFEFMMANEYIQGSENHQNEEMEKFAELLAQRITQIWGIHMTEPDKLLLVADYLKHLSPQERQAFLSHIVNRFAKNPSESIEAFQKFLEEQKMNDGFRTN
ncbi:hypothetical protein IT408_00735 [Candidatus Uhrbacteria bacterium]|nr:hypothetical protein [Candidatus Uhrbacteria bacterium]